MVNVTLPKVAPASCRRARIAKTPRFICCAARHRAFAQILGKLYFFQLLENLRRILLDYGQKHTGRANAAFKAPC